MKKISSFKKLISISIISLIGFCPVVTNAVNTHIQTDGSLPGINELHINAIGNNQIYTLSEINGKLSGQNLFFSFSDFNIGSTDTAWFNLNTLSLNNVISRVTGGAESFIIGNLLLTNLGSTPAFYFINPAGITFGAGATVDVPGSFYVSTANGLIFNNSDQFLTSTTNSSSLSSASPESFGFLENETGTINIGSSDTDTTNLMFNPGANVVFAASDITIENASIANKVILNNDAIASGIQLKLSAVGQKATTISLFPFVDQLQLPDGTLAILNSNINVSGNGSGYLGIQSGNFTGINSKLFADNTGEKQMTADHGTDIFVKSNLIIDNTQITNDALNTGDAGLLNISAKQIVAQNKAEISSNTYHEGAAGKVSVTAGFLTLTNGSIINSSSFGNGNANVVSVKADQIKIDGFNNNFPTGIATNAAFIFKDGDYVLSSTSGSAGIVFVEARMLDLTNGGKILSLVNNSSYNDFFYGSDIRIVADHINLSNNALISTATYGLGHAGSLVIQVNSINLENSSSIDSSAKENSVGNAGTVSIIGKESSFTHMTHITSANSVKLENGSSISTNSLSNSTAGHIYITYQNLILNSEAKIQSNAALNGQGGNILLSGGNFTYLHNSIIQSNAQNGQGGMIYLGGGNLTYLNNSLISTSAVDGNGGDIFVEGLDYLVMQGGFIQSNTEGSGNAGKIAIDGQTTIIASNETLITSEKNIVDFGTGRNGRTINVMQTAAPNALSGNTSFSLPQLNLNAMMINLPVEKFDSRILNQDMCVVEECSSLMISGRGGLPSRTSDFLQ